MRRTYQLQLSLAPKTNDQAAQRMSFDGRVVSVRITSTDQSGALSYAVLVNGENVYPVEGYASSYSSDADVASPDKAVHEGDAVVLVARNASPTATISVTCNVTVEAAPLQVQSDETGLVPVAVEPLAVPSQPSFEGMSVTTAAMFFLEPPRWQQHSPSPGGSRQRHLLPLSALSPCMDADLEARAEELFYLVRSGSNTRVTNRDNTPLIAERERVAELQLLYSRNLGPVEPMTVKEYYEHWILPAVYARESVEMRAKQANPFPRKEAA